MRNIFRNTIGAVAAGLFLVAALATTMVVPAWSQAVPGGQRSFSPRMFNTQQVHYLRFTFNFNSCVIPAGAAVCNVKVGAVPYNSWLKSVSYDLITVFNPTTSATISLGTNTTATNILAAKSVFTGATLGPDGYVFCGTSCGAGTFAGIGMSVTGATTAQTGTLGGFDIYAAYTTGANGSQGTTGSVVFVIEYYAPNDGSCAPVPLGSTAVAC
jgi:hypothetical protein